MNAPLPLPFAIDNYVPPGVLSTLTGAEVGYLYRLLQSAWMARPPCHLPDPLDGLAVLAGAGTAEWAAAAPRVLRAFRRDEDGWTAVELLSEHERRAGLRRVRSDAARSGRSKCSAFAEQMLSKRSGAAPSPIARAPAEALSAQRSLRLVCIPGAPESAGPTAGAGSAERRAPDTRQPPEVAAVRAKLSALRFPWAGFKSQMIPHAKVDELARLPWATEMLADFVAQRIGESHPPNAIGFIFGAFGWVNGRGGVPGHWGSPWDVPLAFASAWHARREQIDRLRSRIDAEQRKLNTARMADAARATGELA